MNTLFARMSLALVVIIGITGSAFFVVERIGADLYYEELTQRLNAPIAMYVTGERTLIRDGNPDIILTGKEAIDSEGMQTMFRLAAACPLS